MPVQFTNGRFHADDAAGNPLAAGRLYTFESGTTTYKATYTTAALNVVNTYHDDGTGALYIELNARGEAAVWMARTGNYTFVLKDSSGVTVWTSDGEGGAASVNDLIALTDGLGGGLVGVSHDAVYAAATLGDRFNRQFFVTDHPFSAAGDGTTDDSAAFLSAIAQGVVLVPPGTYRITSDTAMKLSAPGKGVIGIGSKSSVILLIDQTTGPGITIESSQCVVSNLTVKASDTRQAYTTGATHDLAADLYGIKVYKAGGFTTQSFIDRVAIERHPNHGLYMGGEGAGTKLSLMESNYNRGHGYAFDDRTIGGGSSGRCGIVRLENCRALDNGGNALYLSQSGQTCYRFVIENLETIWNAWNTSIAGLVNAEVSMAGENIKIQQSAFADPNGDARTTMDNGDTRLAKSTLSEAIVIGDNSKNIILENIRYISVRKGVRSTAGLSYLRVKGGYFTVQSVGGSTSAVTTGFDISSGTTDVSIDATNPGTSTVATWITDASSRVLNAIDHAQYGTFTPTISFATVGDLSVSYSSQTGVWSLVGNLLYLHIKVSFTPTYTTASGVLLVNGVSTITGIVIDGSSQAVVPCGNTNNFNLAASSILHVVGRVNSTSGFRIAGNTGTGAVVDITTTHIASGSLISLTMSGFIPITSRTI